ncbi:MAG TPA: hypothetical protein VGV18_04035 [Verrucomicrobiae bacterium]|nr:hypothetical protein [Verrucomicrobiae bacterium]
MKDAVARLLLKLAVTFGAGRVRANVIRESYAQAAANAILAASPVWGVEEAGATTAFLASPAGQLFSKRIRSVAAHVAIEGANDRANTIHSAGVSAGWNECVRYLHSLATCQNAILQMSDWQDAVAHQEELPLENEAALFERLSP